MRPAGTGAAQRWNEDAQRWEYPGEGADRAVASSPPSRPASPPPQTPVTPPTPPGPLPSPSDGSGPAYPAAPPGAPSVFTRTSPSTPAAPPDAPGLPSALTSTWPQTPAAPPGITGDGAAGGAITGGVPGGRRRMLRVAVPVLVVGALAGAALGWHLVRDDTAPPAGSAQATGSAAEPESTEDPAAASEPAATPEESPSPEGSAAPDGYRLVEDPAGFALAVPEDWTRDERDSGVFYTPGDDGSLIQVFEVTEPGITPLESLEAASEHLGSQPGYEEVSLEEAGRPQGASDAVGTDAAELVYAYDSEELGFRKQVVDCVFTAEDGTMYAVLVAGPAAQWPRQQEQLQVALAHFGVL